MFIVFSLTATHRPEGGAPTKSVQLSCGSGALAAMNALHTTTHRSVPLRCTR